MSIVQTLTTSFKSEILSGFHAFDSRFRAADTFFIALYNAPLVLDGSITAYTSTSEVVGSGYIAGGQTVVPTLSGQAISFAPVTWLAALSANCALIYNQSQGNRSVCVLSFGNNKISVASFTIQFPVLTPTSGLLGVS